MRIGLGLQAMSCPALPTLVGHSGADFQSEWNQATVNFWTQTRLLTFHLYCDFFL